MITNCYSAKRECGLASPWGEVASDVIRRMTERGHLLEWQQKKRRPNNQDEAQNAHRGTTRIFGSKPTL